MPNVGQVGTRVVIKGSNLLAGGASIVKVVLAGTEVGKIAAGSSDTEVAVVVARAAASAAGAVVLTADTGAIITKEKAFGYLAEGEIKTVTPSAGQAGTYVDIEGERLLGGSKKILTVHMAGVAAKIMAQSDTKVRMRINTGNKGTSHIVFTCDNGALVTKENGWTYTEPGAVTKVSPAFGQLNTLVTISGGQLRGNGKEVKSVLLSGLKATIVSETDTSVVVRAVDGTGASGQVVELESDSGAIVLVDGLFEYREAGKIASATPKSGQFGTKVAIKGTSLLASGTKLAHVKLAGVKAKIVSQTNTLVELVAAAGPGKQTVGDIVLTADTEATVTSTGGWTYLDAGAVTSLTPAKGQYGTRVAINGANMRGGGSRVASVTLGGVASKISSQTDTLVEVVAAHASATASAVAAVLTSDSGAVVTSAGAWEYLARGEIASVKPSSGQLDTLVTITGARMFGGGESLVSVAIVGVHSKVISSTPSSVVVTAAHVVQAKGTWS